MEHIDALQRGDPKAITWLVETYSTRLLKAATLMLGDEHLAQDAVQDSLVDAVRSLPRFRGDSSLYTWLYTILLRRCRRQRGKIRTLGLVPLYSETGANTASDTHNDFRGESGQKLALRSAIRALRYKYAEAIVLFYYEELSVKEIADFLKEPEGTIKNRLYRARNQLKSLLEGGEKNAQQSEA